MIKRKHRPVQRDLRKFFKAATRARLRRLINSSISGSRAAADGLNRDRIRIKKVRRENKVSKNSQKEKISRTREKTR